MAALAALVVLGLAAWWLLGGQADAPPAPPAPKSEQRPDAARQIVAELDTDDSDALDDAYQRARQFQQDGQLADAQLLYFFAARGGHAEAAFALADQYDPLHHSPEHSLMDEPDPFQALKWYRQAQRSGHPGANARLTALKVWAEKRAAEGDTEAERLLLQWESAR